MKKLKRTPINDAYEEEGRTLYKKTTNFSRLTSHADLDSRVARDSLLIHHWAREVFQLVFLYSVCALLHNKKLNQCF